MLKRILYGSGAMGVMAAGYMLGSVSLSGAFAQTPPAQTPASSPATSPTSRTAPASQTAPAAKEQGEPNEQAESAALASTAKITADQANSAAIAKFPGATVKKTELDSENGTTVYSVELTDSAGKGQDVKVDATTGAVLTSQAEGAEGPEKPGVPEAPGVPETAD
jgi:hypothetical protein